MSTPENKAAIEKIPHYREGTREEQCGNCAFLKAAGSTNSEFNQRSGFCKMFRAYVLRYYVCDEWKERPKRNARFYRA